MPTTPTVPNGPRAHGSSTPRETLRRLKGAQKPPHGTAAYSRFVNRPLGRLFATAAYHAGLSPNQVSLISGGLTMTGIILVAAATPHPATSLLAGLLLVLGYAVDSADGQVARLTGRSSKVGEWLDHTLDAVKMQSIHLAILIHLYRWFEGLPVGFLVLPLAYSVVANVLYFGMMLIDQVRRGLGGTGNQPGPGSLSVLRSVSLLPMDYGTLAVVVATLYWQGFFLVMYALMLAGTAVALALALKKWHAELAAIDAL